MPNFCGGLKFGSTLKIDKGIITLADHTSDVNNVVTPCGQKFDGTVFEVVQHGGINVLSSIGIDEDMELYPVLKTNCGFAIDGRYATITNGVLDWDESYIVEVLVLPTDATITVTYGDEATPVEPILGTTNMFKLTETDETYTITASKEGYTSQEQQITADQNHIVEFTLVEAP